MFDVTAGYEGCQLVAGDALEVTEVVSHIEVDWGHYGDERLSDEELLERAWMELLAAGLPVLGSPVAESDPLDEVITEWETRRDLYPADQLAVRRVRRATRRALRTLGRAAS